MKTQPPKTATAAPKALRKTQRKQPLAARLLTIPLDPDVSKLVLWASRTLGQRQEDVVIAALNNLLPQARDEYARGDLSNQFGCLMDHLADLGNRRIEREDREAARTGRKAARATLVA